MENFIFCKVLLKELARNCVSIFFVMRFHANRLRTQVYSIFIVPKEDNKKSPLGNRSIFLCTTIQLLMSAFELFSVFFYKL